MYSCKECSFIEIGRETFLDTLTIFETQQTTFSTEGSFRYTMSIRFYLYGFG